MEMKQGKLSFTSVKRSATAAGLGKTQSSKAVAQPIGSGASETKPERITLKKEEIVEVCSGSEVDDEKEKPKKEKKGTKTQKTTRRSLGETTELKIQPGPKQIDVSDLPSLDVKSKALDEIWDETKRAMGMPKIKPIHVENDNRVTHILRLFDLNDEYGPFVGIPRMERWERAQKAGLNPPQEVYDILNTKEGVTEARYSQEGITGEVDV